MPIGDLAYQSIENLEKMSSGCLEFVYEVPCLLGDVVLGVIEVEAPLDTMSVRV